MERVESQWLLNDLNEWIYCLIIDCQFTNENNWNYMINY